MMGAYFDSAIIVKLYVQESASPDAIRLAAAYLAPYPLTQWQALEVKNAIRLKVFRGEITSAEMNQSIAAFDQDAAAGRWYRPAGTAAAVEGKAEELSASHSAALGCRTLDIIHVAAALIIGVKEFVTFDGRQAALAKQTSLIVRP
jgi:predicted nucleic acid-binding protein